MPSRKERHDQRLDRVEQMLCQGYGRVEIASRLGITAQYVSVLKGQLRKLGRDSWAKLAAEAAVRDFAETMVDVAWATGLIREG